MFDDPERYEHDGFYKEDTDYEDEYKTDDSDYIGRIPIQNTLGIE